MEKVKSTKGNLVDAVAEKTGLKKADVQNIIDETLTQIVELAHKGQLTITGFATISVVNKPARVARNPGTGKNVDVPAKNALKIAVSPSLNKSLNK